ncbi:hypothetical protein ScPMuIL_008793 [Solemya velum]
MESFNLAVGNETSRPFMENGNRKNRQKWTDRQQKQVTFRQAWVEFSSNTTLHGLRYISETDSFLFRRFFWLLLVLTCSSLMMYQIIDRVIYYSQSPVNVNVKVNYNQSIVFPAITICNQNAFRATRAREYNWYRLFERIYGNLTYPITPEDLAEYNASNIPVDDIFTCTAHEKHDFIVSCTWGNEVCYPENFTTVLTDHGVCYTFNGDTAPGASLVVTSTGAEHGLKLTLNVEQYEYMPGPHDAAGVKLLTHSPKEFPRVHDLGIAIPTGNHAFVGLQVIMINNLPRPHGECGEKPLKYFGYYSSDTCEMDCITTIIDRKCGCRNYYMPSNNGLPRVCTLTEYYTCFLPTLDLLRHSGQKVCECPTPCQFALFDPMISYASTSEFAVDRFLTETSTEELAERFFRAREVTHRVEKIKHDEFKRQVQAVDEKLNLMQTILMLYLRKSLEEQIEELSSVRVDMGEKWVRKEYLYRYQEYVLQKNFLRGRDAIEERTFAYVAFAFQEFSYRTKTKIRELVDLDLQSKDSRTVLYTLLVDSLNDRMETAKRALSNYTTLFQAYQKGTPIFRYKFRDEPRKNNNAIVPKPLLAESLVHNYYAKRYSFRVGSDIQRITDSLDEYLAIANATYHQSQLNNSRMEAVNKEFLDSCKAFFHSRSQFYFETVDRPLRILQERIAGFETAWKEYEMTANDIENNLQQLNESLFRIETDILDNLTEGINLGLEYSKNSSISKASVAEILTSDKLHVGINKMKAFFSEVRSRGQNIFDGWASLIGRSQVIWGTILIDEDLKEYYIYKNIQDFLQNYSLVASEVNNNLSEYRESGDIRFLVGVSDRVFLKTLYELMDSMSDFIDGSKMDRSFFRENFLQMDIFFRELNYEEITQQIGYDIFSLLCDIGGSIGLFIGASVITIFEILDLLLKHSVLRPLIGRRQSTSQS